MPWLNDQVSDQILLKRCLEGDRAAQVQWTVNSYKTEVTRTIKGVMDRKIPGGLDQQLIVSLVVHCTWKIYENYNGLPSSFYSLKTQVRKFALGYANNYLRRYLRAHGVR